MVLLFLAPIVLLPLFILFAEPKSSASKTCHRQWPVITYDCDTHCNDCGHSPMVMVSAEGYFCEKCGSEF